MSKAQDAALLDGSGASYKPSQAQIQTDFKAAIDHLPPLPEQYRVYFESGSTRMTQEATADLPKVMGALKKRQVPDVSVIGHTDTVGTEAFNKDLGLKRANSVAEKIRAQGLDNVEVSVESQGEGKLLVPTKDGVPEPMNRRVEITVR